MDERGFQKSKDPLRMYELTEVLQRSNHLISTCLVPLPIQDRSEGLAEDTWPAWVLGTNDYYHGQAN